MIVVTSNHGNVKDGARNTRKLFMFLMQICVWIQCTVFSLCMRHSQRRDAMVVFRFSSLLLTTLFNTLEEWKEENLVLIQLLFNVVSFISQFH